MICPNCGHDDEKVVRVHRNLIFRDGKWKKANVDTREIICNRCGARYLTETKLTHKIEFDKVQFRKIILEVNNGI